MDISEIELNDNGLRMHQIDAKRKIFTAWRSCDSVMLQMPTGTGKTYLFTSVIKDLLRVYKQAREEINILVVAHRMELLDQISALSHASIFPMVLSRERGSSISGGEFKWAVSCHC